MPYSSQNLFIHWVKHSNNNSIIFVFFFMQGNIFKGFYPQRSTLQQDQKWH